MLGKRLVVEQLCRRHNILLEVVEPAVIFMAGGDQTIFSLVQERFIKASTMMDPTVLLIERCNELVPENCDDSALVFLISSWLYNRSKLVVIATSSEERLHPLWRGLDYKLSMPIELNQKQRREILDVFSKTNAIVRQSDDPAKSGLDSTQQQPEDLMRNTFDDSANGLLDSTQKQLENSMKTISESNVLPFNDFTEKALDYAVKHSGGFNVCDLYRASEYLDSMDDLKEEVVAIKKSLGAVQNSVESVTWDQIIGQEEAKTTLIRASTFLTSVETREKYRQRGLTPPKGVILYGPPGTGKTLLARAAANSSNIHFIPVSIPTILHAPIGESEKALRRVFQEAIRLQPSLIFFDEIDSLVAAGESGSVSEKIAMQLVEELDGLNALVVTIAATNLIESVHPSLRRLGRLDLQVFVGPLSPLEQAKYIQDELSNVGIRFDLPLMEHLDISRTGAQVEQIIDLVKHRFIEGGDVNAALLESLR
ncbi:AAA family ATPase, CDC48 subfamily [Paramicrosporidium saccamoebae]|uniref:AAA family ATPase, CDC48 subfamily n=1 Tax=Paramicrosporidium saccamoebae TaxID=1246581 RepID=A0A2H9THC4_9FUNG|nr:AAA family ATPase, CDC48 subfamily [Paramicrosporidium saccamoebae]